jgi:trk/ktr system potassium uptake protein
MARIVSSEKLNLFGFFLSLIAGGSILLMLPFAWKGGHHLRYIDALFTSASAVCVTGLGTVDTSQFTRFGQIVIMLLIQVGGLGIISFSTLYLATPRRKVSFRSVRLVREYYLDSVEYHANDIVKNIVVATFLLEAIGAVFLYFGFRPTVHHALLFTAIFHSISAFCNAGFSTFSDGMVPYVGDAYLSIVFMVLIVAGGLGFVVIQDLWRRWTGRRRHLSLHTRVVLIATAILILGGTIVYYFLERANELRGLGDGGQVLAAAFQSVTTRTAGFNTIDEGGMTTTSKLFTLLLMFIGGSSGSTAGGIKVSTAAIIVLAMIRGVGSEGEIVAGRRKIGTRTIAQAHIFALKAFVLLFVSILLLTMTELHAANSSLSFLQIVFESFSAFGTVGLTLGATPSLSDLGKVVVIVTMFAGRVGLISVAIPGFARRRAGIDYPEGELLVG